MRKGGAEDPKRSIPGKDEELKPAEVKSHVNQSWKRTGRLFKIQVANVPET